MRSNHSDREGRGAFRSDSSSGEYAAKSLYEASFLYCVGIPLATITGKIGSARFIFDDEDGIARRTVADFHADVSTGAKSLFQALGQLKREADKALGRPAPPQVQP